MFGPHGKAWPKTSLNGVQAALHEEVVLTQAEANLGSIATITGDPRLVSMAEKIVAVVA